MNFILLLLSYINEDLFYNYKVKYYLTYLIMNDF